MDNAFCPLDRLRSKPAARAAAAQFGAALLGAGALLAAGPVGAATLMLGAAPKFFGSSVSAPVTVGAIACGFGHAVTTKSDVSTPAVPKNCDTGSLAASYTADTGAVDSLARGYAKADANGLGVVTMGVDVKPTTVATPDGVRAFGRGLAGWNGKFTVMSKKALALGSDAGAAPDDVEFLFNFTLGDVFIDPFTTYNFRIELDAPGLGSSPIVLASGSIASSGSSIDLPWLSGVDPALADSLRTQFDSVFHKGLSGTISNFTLGEGLLPVSDSGFTGFSFVAPDGSTIGVSGELDAERALAIPEPSAWALSLLGLGAIGGALRARRRQAFAACRVPAGG